nr:hypothetical protein [Enterovibrio nigricans]
MLKAWDTPLVMPKAIRVILETERYGELSRIYLLPAQSLVAASGATQ